MATQADYRMILGIRQQPNQWAEALSNLPGSLMQGLQIGDYFRQMGRENQLQELMRGAIDPQTGEVDTGKALGALMQYDPASGIKLMQQDRLARMQSEGLQAAMSGDYTPEERQILQGYAATGEIGKGIAKIGELRYGKSTAAENRQQQMIPGLDEYGRPVTRTLEQWQQPGGAPAPGVAPTPGVAPAPATSNPANYEVTANGLMDRLVTAESGGQHYGKGGGLLTSPKGAQGITQVMPATGREPGYGVTPVRNNSQQEFLRFGRDYLTAMLKEFNGDPRKAFAAYNAGPGVVHDAVQRYGADWENGLPQETSAYLQKTAGPLGGSSPAAPAPAGPAPVGPAPVSGIRTGLSEQERQAIKIQEENRAEQRRIEEEGRSVRNKIAEETRSLRDKGLSSGDQAWVNEVFSPAIKEYQQNSLVLGDLATMERLNKEGKTGPGSEFQLTLKRGLVAAGMLDPKAVATEQQIISMSNALTWNTLAQQKGPQTDVDFARMQATWPNIMNAGDANQFLIDSKKAILSRRQRQVEFYRNNYQDAVKSGTVLGLEDAWAQTPAAQKSIWDEPIMRKWSLKYPATGQPQSENKADELKFNHPQQDKIDEIKRQLRGGK